jgi:hypothetical protein
MGQSLSPIGAAMQNKRTKAQPTMRPITVLAGFSPDPTAPDYTPYADVTEQQCLDWCFADGVDKDSIEASLQANIDGQINPVTASGVPW